jgi:predicted Fe-Mo cluster-binding NifX family protein
MKIHKIFGIGVIFAGLLLSGAAGASPEDRRIAVASEGPTAEGPVCGVAARAPYILIFDGQGHFLESHRNPLDAGRGAGTALARWLHEQGVGMLIAGNFGPNISHGLGAHRIRPVIGSGPADQAVKEALNR